MGFNEELKEIKEILKGKEEEKLKSKRWRLPWRAKVGKKKQKKNYIGILKINENGSISPTKQQIVEQTVMVDGVPRLSTPDYVLRWHGLRKSFPVMLLPSWSVLPLTPKEAASFEPTKSYEESMQNGSNIKGYKLLMNRMQMSKVDEKKAGSKWWMWLIGVALLGLIVYAFVSGSVF